MPTNRGAFVGGLSTRDIASVTEALLDKQVKRSTVSRVTRRLEDKVESLRRPPITLRGHSAPDR